MAEALWQNTQRSNWLLPGLKSQRGRALFWDSNPTTRLVKSLGYFLVLIRSTNPPFFFRHSVSNIRDKLYKATLSSCQKPIWEFNWTVLWTLPPDRGGSEGAKLFCKHFGIILKKRQKCSWTRWSILLYSFCNLDEYIVLSVLNMAPT